MASNDGFVYKITIQSNVILQSTAAELSEIFKDPTNVFSEKFSDIYKSITVISLNPPIWEIEYAKGCPIKKEIIRVDELDFVNLKLSYTVIGGDILKFYQNFKVSLMVNPNENGCLITGKYEFEKTNTKIGPAVFEFDIVKLIKVDKLPLN